MATSLQAMRSIMVMLILSHLASAVWASVVMVLYALVMLHFDFSVAAVANDYQFTHFNSPVLF